MASVINTITVGTNPSVAISNGTYVWVTNGGSNTVSKIQISTGTVVATIAVGTGPAGISIDTNYIWVANLDNGSGNTVTKINISTDAVISTITVGTGPIGISSDGTYVWVTNVVSNNVSRITISTSAVTTITNAFFNRPTVINADGTSVWLSNGGLGSGTTVSQLDSVGNYTATITVGLNPLGINSDGTYVWVANRGGGTGNTVTQIDASTGTVIATITVGTGPIGTDSDGTYVWVSNGTSNTVTQINASTGTVIATIPVGTGPSGLHSDGTYVWVPNGGGGTGTTVSQIQINPTICYSRGTMILCNIGYVPIEDLKPGDLVKTYLHGDREIEVIGKGTMFNNPNKWSECMYRLPSMNDQFDDLVVTGGHGILKRTLTSSEIDADSIWFKKNGRVSKIDGMYLQRAAFSKEFHQITTNERYTYYHFSLKGPKWKRYGVWANGVLSESTFSQCISKNLKLKY